MSLESVYSLPLSCRHLFGSDDTGVTSSVSCWIETPAGHLQYTKDAGLAVNKGD
jgi:hypothetical protein